MNTNYNREAFVRSLEKLCLLHLGIYSFAQDVVYNAERTVPKDFDPLMHFPFKPVYVFEAYGNSNEYFENEYAERPIFSRNAYLLDRNITDYTVELSEMSEGYELWLLDDMTLAVTYYHKMTAHSDDKFEAVIYRQYMKDGLYKYGENFDADAFWEMMQYIITKYCCCYDECDHKCEECEYGIIISEYENKIKEANEEDDTESEYDCENCPQKDDCIFQK